MFTLGSNIVGAELDHPDNAGLACLLVGLSPWDGGNALCDLSGKTAGAALAGGAAWAGTPYGQSGLSLNGSSGYATATPKLAGATAATVAGWFRGVWAGSYQILFEYSPDGLATNGGFVVYADNGGGVLTVGCNDGSASTARLVARPATGAWFRLAASFDLSQPGASKIRCWLNGLPAPFTGSPSTSNVTGTVGAYTLNIGCRNAASLFFADRIAGLSVSAVARSDAWAARDYEWSQDPQRDPRFRRTSTRSLFVVSAGVPTTCYVPAFAPGWGW